MNSNKINYKELFSLSIIFFYIGLIFINAPGTQNYNAWVYFIELANNNGIIGGYATRVDTYPPLSVLILKIFYNIFSSLGLEVFIAIKIATFFIFYITSLIIYFESRSLKISIFFILTFVISVFGMVDLDIFYAIFLILALISLKKKKLVWFSVYYCLSVLTKWQPIVIFPFLFIYISEFSGERLSNLSIRNLLASLKSINTKNLFKSSSVVLIFILVLSITYGLLPVAKSFYVSINHNYLSGNALNFNWIMTWLLQLSEGNFSPVIIIKKIYSDTSNVVYLGQIIFVFIYLTLLLIFAFKKERSIQDLYYFCMLGSFTIFIFNKGEHQNHLFGASLLFILLLIENRKWFMCALITAIIFNTNLLVFYGLVGNVRMNVIINNYFNLTLILSAFNIFYLLYLLSTIRKYAFQVQGK